MPGLCGGEVRGCGWDGCVHKVRGWFVRDQHWDVRLYALQPRVGRGDHGDERYVPALLGGDLRHIVWVERVY